MKYILTDTELNELIYAEAKLVDDKIDIPIRNTKPGWEKEVGGINKVAATTSKTAKDDKTHRNPTKRKN